MSVALVLAGHGSHISPNTAGIVWRYVDMLRARGIADEITACFWKEKPSFRQVFNTLSSETVVVVPVFTAQGYFTQTVIPIEMGLSGKETQIDGKRVLYTPTLGEHHYLETIIYKRVHDVLQAEQITPEDTTVAIIGHGTRRNRKSRDATIHQANQLRQHNLVSTVVDVYLDDDPDIPTIYQTTSTENIIAVPFFLAEGSHVTIDVPKALGIEYGDFPASVQGRSVFYTPPVGTDDAICDVILELANDTSIDFSPSISTGDALFGFPQSGYTTFKNALTQHVHGFELGQLYISPNRVSHIADQDVETREVALSEIRAQMRENPFRPLPTSDDLPRGWHVSIQSSEMAFAVVETIYPGLLADWALSPKTEVALDSLEAIGKRQTGMFENIHKLPQTAVLDTVATVCQRCICQPSWLNGHQADNPKIRCSTPCNIWLATAKAKGE